jgi:hypothetical protein
VRKLVYPIAIFALTCVFAAPAMAQHDGHNHGHDMAAGSAFASMITPYEAIHDALAGDSIKDITKNAKEIQKIAEATSKNFNVTMAGVSEENAKACQELLPEVAKAATKLAAAGDISSAREAFGELSRPLVRYREMLTGENTKVAYCPMAKKPWLQTANEIENPYYGASMLRCGSFVSK